MCCAVLTSSPTAVAFLEDERKREKMDVEACRKEYTVSFEVNQWGACTKNNTSLPLWQRHRLRAPLPHGHKTLLLVLLTCLEAKRLRVSTSTCGWR